MSEDITAEDRERINLLQIVSSSKNEFKNLSLVQLKRLQELVEKKDYSHNKKAHKSKVKLLGKINVRIYELEEGKGIFY
jgi:predicted nucleotide-binding protein (sugar kinase/HSP70/actin superfamily)